MKAAVGILCLVASAVAAPQEGYSYSAPGDQGFQLPAGGGAGAVQSISGTGQFSGVGQFSSGGGQYSSGTGQFGSGFGQEGYPSVPAQYTFQWDVNDQRSRNFYGHQEERENENTRGKYYVLLPDGRQLIVEYYVDNTGYHPTITFEGEAQTASGPRQGYQGASGPQQGFAQGGPGLNQGFPQVGPGQGQGLPQPGSVQAVSPALSYIPPAK